ncbi:MAG TPA: hypothetical protein ENH10_05750 [Bacteroidetes bacterium]|nr:hypothetical protein BMS3Bbin04_01975 [bacterium BMS3Bbin04]HDO65523.1 hypothetical protein [Bacteroidota bacterium]HEX04648.1 hypothetical protein [Bacteroidota bacterium]
MLAKTQKFRLDAKSTASFQRLEFSVGSLRGVLAADLNRDTGMLVVTYDLLRTNFTCIEQHLIQNDARICKRPWWKKMQIGMIRYLEQNERENHRAKPSGCCAGFERGGHGTGNTKKQSVASTLQPM